MTRNKLFGVLGSAGGVLGATILVASCGSDSGGTSDVGVIPVAFATIDAVSVTKMLPEISRVVPICSKDVAAPKGLAKSPLASIWTTKLLAVRAGMTGPTTKALTGTPPSDTMGSCGGRVTYLNYSHLSGVTSATLAFQDYCTKDATGAVTLVNGTIPFVNTGTPSASGPIFQKLEASSQGDIAVMTKDSTGAVLSTEKLSFSNFVYNAGVPGGAPTAVKPDTVNLGNAVLTSKDGKTYRQSNYALQLYETSAGGEQISMSGTGYRSDGSSYTVTTTAPMTLDSSGNWVAGTLTFAGTNGSNAVATVVPGIDLQATMTVNGQAVTSGVACN